MVCLSWWIYWPWLYLTIGLVLSLFAYARGPGMVRTWSEILLTPFVWPLVLAQWVWDGAGHW